MDDVQPCLDSSDLTELSIPQQLFLKPEAKLSLTVALPAVRLPGKTISNWEVIAEKKLCRKLKGKLKEKPVNSLVKKFHTRKKLTIAD